MILGVRSADGAPDQMAIIGRKLIDSVNYIRKLLGQ